MTYKVKKLIAILLAMIFALNTVPITAIAEQIEVSNRYIIQIKTFQPDGSTPYTFEPGKKPDNDYYLRTLVYNWSNNQPAGWALQKIDWKDHQDTVTINIEKFYPLHQGVTNNDQNAVQYNGVKHYINPEDLTIIHYQHAQNINNWYQVQDVEEELPTGFVRNDGEVLGNNGYRIDLKKDNDKVYHVAIAYDGDKPTFPAGKGELYVLVSMKIAEHGEDTHIYGYVKMTDDLPTVTIDGKTYIDVQISEWLKKNKTPAPPHFIFTGNEISTSVQFIAWPNDVEEDKNRQTLDNLFDPAQKLNVNDVITEYTIKSYPSADTRQTISRENTFTDDVYDFITLKKDKNKITRYNLENILNGYNLVSLCENDKNPKQAVGDGNITGTYTDGDVFLVTHAMGGVLVRGDLIFAGGSGVADSKILTKPSAIGGTAYDTTDGGNIHMGPISNTRNGENPPNLYIGEGYTIYGPIVNGVRNINLNPKGNAIINPNYVNWDVLQSSMISASNSLYSKSTRVINVTSSNSEHIEINADENVTLVLSDESIQPHIYIIGANNADSDNPTSTIINVTGSDVFLPLVVEMNGVSAGNYLSYNTAQGTGADNEKEDGSGMSILFNFPEASHVKLTSDDCIGHVLAPHADVRVEGGNYNGCIVANSIASNGEGHQWPYNGPEGSLITTEEGFTARKTVNGKIPTSNEIYTFKLEALDNNAPNYAWHEVETKTNNGARVEFSKIIYGNGTEGIHYYKISEVAGSVTDGSIPDTSIYIVRVVVTRIEDGDDVIYQSSTKYFKVKDGESEPYFDENRNMINSKFSTVYTIKFDNTKQSGLSVKKEVEGTDSTNDVFTFKITLTEPDGETDDDTTFPTSFATTGTGINTLSFQKVAGEENKYEAQFDLRAGQTITFSGIPVGTGYTVEEIKINSKDIPSDGSPVDGFVQKSVTENSAGTIEAGENTTILVTFTNELKNGSLKIKKSVFFNGQESNSEKLNGTYKFYIQSGDGVTPATRKTVTITVNNGVQTAATIDGVAANIGTDGYVTVGDLPAGEYTVTEDTDENPSGVALLLIDGSPVTVTAGDTADIPTVEVKNNSAETTISFPVTKEVVVPGGLTGPADWSFTLTVAAQNGAPEADTMSGSVTKAAPTATFGPFTYTAPGTYNYNVTESGEIDGITNDATATKTVTVTVVDNQDGTLTATSSSTTSAPVKFTNNYSASGDTNLYATKVINHWGLAEKFTFILAAGTNDAGVDTPMPEDATDGELSLDVTKEEMTVDFGTITYTKPGTYNYTITETDDGVKAITYDTTPHAVVVTVVDNQDGNLIATPTYDEKDELKIKNTYNSEGEIKLYAKKKLVRGDLASGMFSFGLYLVDDTTGKETLITTVSNDVNGIIAFEELEDLKYNQDDLDGIEETEDAKGRRVKTRDIHYRIKEIVPEQKDDTIIYDMEPVNITVTLVDDLQGTIETSANPDATISNADAITVTFTNIVTKILKVDAENNNLALPGAVIEIYDDASGKTEPIFTIHTTEEPIEIEGLEAGKTYRLHEASAPTGYLPWEFDAYFTVDEDGNITVGEILGSSAGASDDPIIWVDDNGIIRVKDTMTKLSVAVHKVWDDDENRDGLRPTLTGITVNLLRNGQQYRSVTLNPANNWTAVLTGLDSVYVENGAIRTYEYTWSEPSVNGYALSAAQSNIVTVSLNMQDGEGILTTLTNVHTPETTEIKVRKVWVDDGSNWVPITVQLYADGQAVDTLTLSDANGWAGGWTNLPKYTNPSGQMAAQKDIEYTVAETKVPDGYIATITRESETSFVIRNTKETGKLIIEKEFAIEPWEPELPDDSPIDIPVIKTWNDNNNADGNRPGSVTVHLLADGVEVASAQLSEQNNWQTVFTGLPRLTEARKKIVYTITEDPVEWYEAEIHGYNIRNNYRPELTSMSVRKIWDDDDNAQRIRPRSIVMTLTNDVTAQKWIAVLNRDNNWSATVDNLPTRINGQPVTYTWTEPTIAGYRLSSVRHEGNVTIFTNTIRRRKEGDNPGGRVPDGPGEMTRIDDYDTPLGVDIMINHVGDCFD